MFVVSFIFKHIFDIIYKSILTLWLCQPGHCTEYRRPLPGVSFGVDIPPGWGGLYKQQLTITGRPLQARVSGRQLVTTTTLPHSGVPIRKQRRLPCIMPLLRLTRLSGLTPTPTTSLRTPADEKVSDRSLVKVVANNVVQRSRRSGLSFENVLFFGSFCALDGNLRRFKVNGVHRGVASVFCALFPVASLFWRAFCRAVVVDALHAGDARGRGRDAGFAYVGVFTVDARGGTVVCLPPGNRKLEVRPIYYYY